MEPLELQLYELAVDHLAMPSYAEGRDSGAATGRPVTKSEEDSTVMPLKQLHSINYASKKLFTVVVTGLAASFHDKKLGPRNRGYAEVKSSIF